MYIAYTLVHLSQTYFMRFASLPSTIVVVHVCSDLPSYKHGSLRLVFDESVPQAPEHALHDVGSRREIAMTAR